MTAKRFGELLTESILMIGAKNRSKTINSIETELGRRVGKSRFTIQHWRKGHLPPDTETLEQLAQALMENISLSADWMRTFLEQGEHPNIDSALHRLYPGRKPETESQPSQKITEGAQISPSSILRSVWQKRSHFLGIPKWFWGITGAFFLMVMLMLLTPQLVAAVSPQGWILTSFAGVDDRNLILVNQHIIAAHSNSGIDAVVNLAAYQSAEQPITVTFINLNGPREARWNFGLAYRGETRVTDAETCVDDWSIAYWQTIRLWGDGRHQRISESSQAAPSSSGLTSSTPWVVEIQSNGLAVVLIDNIAVAGSYPSPSGVFGSYNLTPYITSAGKHQVTVSVWGEESVTDWRIVFYHHGEIAHVIEGRNDNSLHTEAHYETFEIESENVSKK